MGSKRYVISLREDELKLLQIILSNYQDKLPAFPVALTPEEHAAERLRSDVYKIYKKMEIKNER